MRRIFQANYFHSLKNLTRFQFNKLKTQQNTPPSSLKNSLFNRKSFPQIINIIKNPDNPYPKNSAYYNAVLQFILQQSNQNSKIMIDHGQVIHVFLQDVMERIKTMGAKELSDMLTLLKFRPKALRFQKQLLITMHVRFQTRMIELIKINQQDKQLINTHEILEMQDVKNQIQGLFELKKNTTILHKVLNYAYGKIIEEKQSLNQSDKNQVETFQRNRALFYQIIGIVNENIQDTIDPVRQSIAQFLQVNYKQKTLEYHRQIIRMISKCKFYKNYPLVRNEDWIHQYVYSYLTKIIKEEQTTDIQEIVNILKSSITYSMHLDPESREGFVQLIEIGYQLAKRKLLALCYLQNKDQISKQLNTISLQIKLIPSYLYLKMYYQVNTVLINYGNKVDPNYIKAVIQEMKPIINKFILVYFQKTQTLVNGVPVYNLSNSIDQNIKIINEIIKKQQNPQKLLLKSVQNLLNAVTVFKDYNIINIDLQFSLLLIETQTIYCILCRQWISDQVRYLRLLQHSVFVLNQLQRQLENKNPQFVKYEERIRFLKNKLIQELSVYDNVQKSYKQFTVLRLVSILRCMSIKPKFLGDYYRNIKYKKPNIYVQTLSRTMLKVYNYDEIIDAFQLMFEGKISLKQIELGRIVFLSSKEPQLLKYWVYKNRQHFVSKVCFCRRIMNNIVSIIRMDNLEINRNSIQILAEIVTQNKLFEIQNNSISNHQQSNALKKILCNNFSILFRYSKMDSMIQDVFIVNKNFPTLFRNKFSHIEMMKILTFSAYLSQQQSIFYVNRQNKNALFKYVIMLMKKQPFCQRNRQHYLLGKGYNDQSVIVQVVDKIIEQYWPDNKMMNKGMPFYAEFLSYYTKINKFDLLVKNQNTTFLIIKQILQDYKQLQSYNDFKYLISRIQSNYQRLHYLSIFENETNISNTLQNVASSMNFVLNMKVFGQFGILIQKKILKQIEQHRQSMKEGKLSNSSHKKEWKKYQINKYLANIMIMEKLQQETLEEFSEIQILSLLTVDIMVHGVRDIANQNMQVVMKRLVKINPTAIRYQYDSQGKKKYPFQLFKVALSNLNIYIANRQKRLEIGKEMINDEITNEKICEWVLKCLLTYAREINNNEELLNIVRYLNNWNVDILSLIQNRFLQIRQNIENLASAYFDIQFLSILFSQNIIRYNKQKQASISQITQFSNQKIVTYITIVLKEMQQTYIANNYGIYFQQEGQKALNIIKGLLIMILQNQKVGSKLHKDATQNFKIVKQIFQDFNKVSQKTAKYNKLRNGGRYSYLYNQDQGQTVDMKSTASLKRNKNPYNQQKPDQQSVSLKIFSKFSEILEIVSLVRFHKWSAKNFNAQHQEQIKKINKQISKRQKALFIHSDLSYFTNTQILAQQKQFAEIGLTLYAKKSPTNDPTVLYYLVDEKQSILYDFVHKRKARLTGEEQMIIDYIQTLVNVSKQMQTQNPKSKIQIKVIKNNLTKAQLKAILSS